ncbi:MAG: HEAT repeat domain-containing protein, partial [Gemmatimonadota bacterium]
MIRTTRLLALLLVAPTLAGTAQVAPRTSRHAALAAQREMERSLRLAELDRYRVQGQLARTRAGMLAPRAELARVQGELQRAMLTDQLAMLALTAELAQVQGELRRAMTGRLAMTRSFATEPPEPGTSQDPGDSLYRAARQALNGNDYGRAVELFRSLRNRYPKSTYVPDSYYWEAYGLMRRGNPEGMRVAARVLQEQATRFPEAATRSSGDARALEARIRGELARQGDARAAEQLAVTAELAGTAPLARPTTPTPMSPPRAPAPPSGLVPGVPRPSRSSCGDDDDVQVAALNAVMQMDGARALPILKKVLARRDPGSTCLRRKAVFIVSQVEGRETEDILLAAARTDPDTEVREQAVFWLSQVDSERAVAALDSILFSAKEPTLQEKALFALSQHESPTAHRALRRYAERSDLTQALREKAIFWLGQSDDPTDQAYLISLYPKVTEAGVKERILFSVGQSEGPSGTRFLTDVARNTRESIDLRKKALFWMGQRSEATGADIGSLYGTFAEREIKEQLIFILSQMDDKAAIDKMIDIARREPDKELRKKAIFWLSQ